MTQNQTTTRPRTAAAWLLFATAIGASLAGCLALDDESDAPAPPTPHLQVDRMERWSGEPFTLDARGSEPNGSNITIWRLDLGDGTTLEGDNISEAHVQHSYAHGGAYVVVLELTAGTENGENLSATTTETLIVHERHEIPERVLHASLLNDTGESTHVFETHENATSWEAEVNLENIALVGESTVTIRVVDAMNQTLAEDNATIAQGENWTLHLDGAAGEGDELRIEIHVENGTVRTDGLLRVYYAPWHA